MTIDEIKTICHRNHIHIMNGFLFVDDNYLNGVETSFGSCIGQIGTYPDICILMPELDTQITDPRKFEEILGEMHLEIKQIKLNNLLNDIKKDFV